MKAEQAEWVAEDGCIYTKDPINKFKREHDKVTFEVRASIAFNLHPKIAEHIVDLHNRSIHTIHIGDIKPEVFKDFLRSQGIEP